MATKKQEGRIINLKDKVTVTATTKAKHHKAGSEITCHPEVAAYLIKIGHATEGKAKKEKND